MLFKVDFLWVAIYFLPMFPLLLFCAFLLDVLERFHPVRPLVLFHKTLQNKRKSNISCTALRNQRAVRNRSPLDLTANLRKRFVIFIDFLKVI